MLTLGIYEILNKIKDLKNEDEKVAWLKQNDSRALRWILMCMYDKERVKYHIPQSEPPYTPSDMPDSQGMIHTEARKIPYFVVGQAGENLKEAKRQHLFITMLESVHKDDAKILIQMLLQKPVKGLTVRIINKAFEGLVAEQPKPKAKAKKAKSNEDEKA